MNSDRKSYPHNCKNKIKVIESNHMRAEELHLLIVENIAQDHQNRGIA
ncbi:hypothetical protein HMPREF1547_02595 [Blautia sp. KLE 1732]|nr:hypothetical protein HMPREF1547_02595 [Blautia sp. KLE 1732]